MSARNDRVVVDGGKGLARLRCELPAPHHDQNSGCGERERQRPEEPAEITECEEKRALAAIEVAAGEGSVIVKRVQFEGGAEGIAREALSETARGADTIQFD